MKHNPMIVHREAVDEFVHYVSLILPTRMPGRKAPKRFSLHLISMNFTDKLYKARPACADGCRVIGFTAFLHIGK